ncbi:MAG TPA: NAD-binding protein [Dermatophilaceae bacterium]|nr:NAD-binding protein [Dermatophilaceae bacterium]
MTAETSSSRFNRPAVLVPGTQVALPERGRSPWAVLSLRLGLALALLAGVVLTVYIDRDGYQDSVDGYVSFVDAVYYTTVTLSTTGYGDITPASDTARLVNAFVITPARVVFLVLLIGTTLEVLTAQGRNQIRVARWRKRLKKQVVVVGYGTKGRTAVETLMNNGRLRSEIVVVDIGSLAMSEAHADGLAVVVGDGTRSDVLNRAAVPQASHILVTTNDDAINVLVVLTARQLNPNAVVIGTVRQRENVPLMRQSGATAVVLSADAVGRLLGLATVSPNLGAVLQDLLTYGEGLEVAERAVSGSEVGQPPTAISDQAIAVVRDGQSFPYYHPGVSFLARGDRVVVVRPAQETPWAPRPGTHGESSEPTDLPDL